MSMIDTSYRTKSYGNTATVAAKQTKEFQKASSAGRESVVDGYKRRHPESAAHVDKQVQAGQSVRRKNGAEDVAREDMTMAEYQKYFFALLGTIPYDPTRMNDDTVISISDKGWEQMKKDPDYEAWILGYFAEDRAVRNPFFAWGADSGSFITEKFGASIEEHHGTGYSKSALKGDKKKDDGESWWLKRHKRMQEFMQFQEEKARKETRAQREALQQEYIRQQYESGQRLRDFLISGTREIKPVSSQAKPPILAGGAYASVMDLFMLL